MSVIIRARAPLRLGLAGGGTDVDPYCNEYGGCVLNATINRYAYASIRLLDEPVVRFVATDLQVEESMRISENVPLSLTGKLNLHIATYNHLIENYNGGKFIGLKLITFSEAPIGSGLGSSSALVVVIIKAFSELLNLPLDDYTTARIAFKIERQDCGLHGGRQDQYSATFGGFNFMEFNKNDHTVITPLRIKNWVICEMESSLVLYFTGVSRKSAEIITEQSDNVKTGSIDTINAMHGIKKEAQLMKECLLKGDFEGFVASMKAGWLNKKMLAKAVSNANIDNVYNAAMRAGALAGKVSGAGGGGFMMFFVPAEKRMNVIRALDQFDGHVSNCNFTKSGTQAWRV